jgi:hypothetical protein
VSEDSEDDCIVGAKNSLKEDQRKDDEDVVDVDRMPLRKLLNGEDYSHELLYESDDSSSRRQLVDEKSHKNQDGFQPIPPSAACYGGAEARSVLLLPSTTT